MAKRMIRDFTNSEKVNKLSAFAETFFTRLMMKACDYGAFYGHTRLLLSNLFPLKESITEEMIISAVAECEAAGVTTIYEVDGKRYIWIHDFGQRLRYGNKLKFPLPPFFAAAGGGNRPEVEIEVEVEIETEIEDEDGDKKSPKRKHSFPDSPFFDFDYLKERLISAGPPYSEVDFIHYYDSAKNGSKSKGYKYLNWKAAIMNWIRMDLKSNKVKWNDTRINESNILPPDNIKKELGNFLHTHREKYFITEVAQAGNELNKFVNQYQVTEEKLAFDDILKKKFAAEDTRIYNKYIRTAITKEINSCWLYYAKQNFIYKNKPITSWIPILASWMERRDEFAKKN